MPFQSRSPQPITLELPSDEQWTLHHILLHRIEREGRTDDATVVDPPPLEIYQAFDIVDAGESQFSVVQLEAIQDILAEYHHAATWEIERIQVESILHRIATALEEQSETQVCYPSTRDEP